jgi:L-aminopeptidase/D-esterase-like protein
MKLIRLTDIPGVQVGHAHNLEAATGCTVALFPEGAVGGVDVRGGAPGTRETDLLSPLNLVEKVHGVLLAGGSAFGLDAAAGVMRYLEERSIGFDVEVTRVPIVTGAVIFDLACGEARVRPDAAMGYQACLNASRNPFSEGSVGAGTGATIGKIRGLEYAMKGGLGACAYRVGDLMVGALVAVNCFGDVVDPETGRIVAGALDDQKQRFVGTEQLLIANCDSRANYFTGNTTIGAVVTNAVLTKAQATKVAGMAHNGLARSIRPVHTLYDGDTLFALGTGEIDSDVNVVGVLACRAVEAAVLNAVKQAQPLAGFKSWLELNR